MPATVKMREYVQHTATLMKKDYTDLFDSIGIKGRDFVEWLPVVPRFQLFLIVIA